VIRSLKKANQPAVTGVSVNFDLSDSGLSIAYRCPEILPPVFSGEKLVVYGLSDVPAEKDSIEGTATLKGDVLGNPIQHTVPFSCHLRSSSDGSSVYSVHHLAAKALISDWQKLGLKPTEDIVKLSVEASVVSSHTAFIAVDEGNSEPIRGALRTWDLYPTCSRIEALQMQVDSVKSTMLANIDRAVMRCDNLEDMSEQLSSSSHAFQRAYHKTSGGFFSGLTSFFSGLGERLFGADSSTPTSSSLTAETSTSETLESSDSDGDLAAMETAATPAAVGSSPSDSSSPANILSSVIAAQKADGSWNLDFIVSARLLSMTKDEIEEACPMDLKESPLVSAVWATVLVLTVLEKKCEQQEMEWELLAVKAEKWLQRQTIPGDTEIGAIRNCASIVIGMNWSGHRPSTS
jgi:hypothetical protein